MQSFRPNRRIALLAVAALLFATTTYLAHSYGDSAGPHSNVQCDLCLQFSGTAGAPVCGGGVGKPPLIARVPPESAFLALPEHRKGRAHLPRGPPAHSVI